MSTITKIIMFVVLAFFMFSVHTLAQLQTENDYYQGKLDGENEGKAKGAGAAWFFIGCAGTPIWPYILEPDVPSAASLIGKSPQYIMAYNEGYKSAVKAERVKKAWYGCIASGVTYIAFYGVYFIALAAAY